MTWKHTSHGKTRSGSTSTGVTKHGKKGSHAKMRLPSAAKRDPWQHKAEAKHGGAH